MKEVTGNHEYYSINYAQQGWQCPLCKRIYSPTIPECLHCNNNETTLTTTTENLELLKEEDNKC